MRRTPCVAALGLAAALAASCRQPPRRHPPAGPLAASAPRPAAAPRVNPEAQQKSYDLGVVHFGEERYLEARNAWAEAYRLGPASPLGKKAQLNLQKADAILKRLQELDGQ